MKMKKTKTFLIIFLMMFINSNSESRTFSILDMYSKPIQEASVCFSNMKGDTVEKVSSKTGQVSFQCPEGDIVLSASKEGYSTRYYDISPQNCSGINKGKVILIPDKPGLYDSSNRLIVKKHKFSFKKAQMQGLLIPAYYDGRYFTSDFDTISTKNDTVTLYWVPLFTRTLRENPFASKGGVFVYNVNDDSLFVTYDRGQSEGTKIEVLSKSLINEKNNEFTGLVQQKVQAFEIKIPLAEGRYVLFQGGGNSMDKEPHPDKDLGCYPFIIKK